MKIYTFKGRLLTCLLCLLLAGSLLSTAGFARGILDTAQPTSLTIEYPCYGAAFSLYRAASVSAYGEYALTGDFTGYAVSLEQPDQAGWRALAAALEAYAARDGLVPLASGQTDADGRLVFAGLEPGMYLVTGQRCTSGGYRYTPEPFLVSLPGLNEADDWVADVTVAPKYDRVSAGGGGGSDTIRRKVLKVWEDSEDPSGRPGSVTVQLLRNGKVWDTVTLSDENNWRYEWPRLDDSYNWLVTEAQVPEDYTVTVDREGITFVMTNTLTEDIPEGPIPEQPAPDSPPPGGGTDTELPDDPTPASPGSGLPQTGVLWWPVPLMACGGLGLFLAGWVRRNGGSHE